MAVNPSPFGPKPQFELATGAPNLGGQLFFYVGGSVNTKQNTYTDSTGGSANTNPIVLNALGQPANEIWFTAGQAYKVVYAPAGDTDPPSSPIWSVDNLRGINDTTVTSGDQWIASGIAPTFVSTTQFTMPGDQTSNFAVGRRVKCTVTAGTVYGRISVSAYAALTTVTLVMDGSSVLDSGLSAVSYGLLSSVNYSWPPTLIQAGSNITITYDSSGRPVINGAAAATTTPSIPVRQTVLGGPVDSSGLPNFGGSTGSTTVTASGTLYATAANGFGTTGGVDRVGNIVNPSWTGLSTNGTMYIYLDIASDGTCTTGSTTLAPTYQFGGTYSVTSGQNTFNIQEMTMKAGNGSVASQVYRVFVGEVTVAGGVVTAITWYALMGRYESAQYGYATNTAYTQNHNLGTIPRFVEQRLVCQTAELGYSIGDEVSPVGGQTSNAGSYGYTARFTKLTQVLYTASSGGVQITNNGTGAVNPVTVANWKFKTYIQRGW